eukprot:15482405-Alexandrium_andersonii.AAC.1
MSMCQAVDAVDVREVDRPLGPAVGDLANARGEVHVVATAGEGAHRQQRPLRIRRLEGEAAPAPLL